ncbi:DUF982 domain-containing protein [Rhizobium sp. C4]|uniref:DUF982 domain-containing protein n=1 Tax=Rhizobium sp. C4 TaxID=1349800 RepID=UPI001E494A14|nr:DUF982 domain-containing protein [Rhizobium sp. C4]MCD2173141.1 DUF982 domain-containing protein [Rhizobium sp. C4]
MMLVSVRWTTPVMVTFGNGADRQFDCVHDALDCLQHEWPSPRGKRHAKAVEVLGGALARLVPVEDARKAFVSACVESGILVPQVDRKVSKTRKFGQVFTRDGLSRSAGLEGAG